jgi:hypothetical protein
MSQTLYRIEKATQEDGPWTAIEGGALLSQQRVNGTLGAFKARHPDLFFRTVPVEPVKFVESPETLAKRAYWAEVKKNSENLDTYEADMYVAGATSDEMDAMTVAVTQYLEKQAQPMKVAARPLRVRQGK